MAEFNAARDLDDIAHTASKGWMVAGLIGGAILGAAAVVVTGGAALAVVSAAAAGACAAGGIGEVLGSMTWAPRHNTGKLTSGSLNVFVNSRAAIRAHLSKGNCDEHSGLLQLVAEGSDKVFINNFPAARIGDRLTCSAEISSGSDNVFVGGGKYQTDLINPEIPGWVNWLMMGVGTAAVAVIASPAIALLGLAGAFGGGYAGSWLGGKIFGEGSDGQKWSMLAGSFIGGYAGGKGGMKFDAWRAGGEIKANGVPLSDEKIAEIQNIEKNLRPEPETYLPKDYIADHARAFENGASRIVTRKSFDEYGIGKPDLGKTEYVLTKERASEMINETNGDNIALAEKLGIPSKQLDGDSLVLIEFKPTELYSPKMPTGREFGANDQWIPGGKLPRGDLEAVVKTEGMVKGKDYIATDLFTGEAL
ncbi:PAAR domain-containing protein [Pantoea ananatis]